MQPAPATQRAEQGGQSHRRGGQRGTTRPSRRCLPLDRARGLRRSGRLPFPANSDIPRMGRRPFEHNLQARREARACNRTMRAGKPAADEAWPEQIPWP